jgi:hypothetical protein
VDTIISGTALSLALGISDTLYHWQVRAIDVCGNEGLYSQTWNLQLDFQNPDVPSLIAPYNNNWIDSTSIVFAWTEVAKKASPTAKASEVLYVIQLDTSNTFAPPTHVDTTIALLDTIDLAEGRYYWRVMAYDLAGNYGTYAGYRTFGIDTTAPLFQYVRALPDDPSAPYGPYEVTGKVLDLSGVKTASLYWQVNGGAWSNTAMAYSADSLRDSIPSQNVPIYQSWPVNYYVKAVDLLGHVRISSTYSFNMIGPIGVTGNPVEALPPAFALNGVYPNPSRGQTTFKYQLPKASPVNLEIYNVAGQLVKSFDQGTKPAGYHQINWNGNSANGVYCYRLRAGSFTAAGKVILLR